MSREINGEASVGFLRRVSNALLGFIVCGKRENVKKEKEEDSSSLTVYKYPEVTVPWQGPVFKYPDDRFLTNAEMKEQLELLQMRVIAQNQVLREKRRKIENALNFDDRQRRVAMVETIRKSADQFERINALVEGLKERQTTENNSKRYAVASTITAPE